ncbi:hypothetical protein Agub_g1881, partial [Astrephomene gubernaculifera]
MSLTSICLHGPSVLGNAHRQCPWASRSVSLDVARGYARAPCLAIHYQGSKHKHGAASVVEVAEVVGPANSASGAEKAPERFLDVNAILTEFNPLRESHLLVWGDSDDEDDTVQAEVPTSNAWEDSASGPQGLENEPSWIDYRAGSESDDPSTPALSPESAALLQGARPGASRALAAVMPQLDDDDEEEQGEAAGRGQLPAGAIPNAYSPEAGFQEISPTELAERLATGQISLLLDVRSREEVAAGGMIGGALNLPLDPDLSAAVRAGSLEAFRERPVAVVCASGMRSGQATVRLTKVFGFSNVTNMAGG